MQLQFGQPLWLLAAIPLLLHVWWMARRLQMLAPLRRAFAVGLRTIIVILLVGALAGARVAKLTRDVTVLFAVDNSDSVPEKQKDYERLFVQKALHGMDHLHDKAGVVVFGAGAAVEDPPDARPEFNKPQAIVNTSRTNIGDAIQLALACLPEESQKRIILMSDGNANAGDADAAARAAAAARVPIDVVPLQYENRNDVILEKVIVENRVSRDAPFDLRIVATARQKTHATLNILEDGQVIGRHDVDLLPDQKNVFTYSTKVNDSGYHRFEVQIDAPDDAIPENNRADAYTYVQGEPRILLVDGDPKPQSEALTKMLASEKINVQHVSPDGLPANLREMQTYDAIVFSNVPAGDVSADQMKMIERAEHDLGVGFIMIGGEHSFGAGGYKDTPIERILPVNMDLKNDRIMPKGAIVPIVHTVEIPQGQYWCVQIVQAALDVLSPQDEMGVVYYAWNRQETWLFPLQPVGDKTKLSALIQGIQPGDMPSFDRTLQMAYDALVASNASVKHMVIISDGDPQTNNMALIKKIQDAKITMSTVCINPHNQRDVDVMKALADAGNGRFYNPTNYNNLPQIFIKEAATVRKSLLFEEPFTARPAQSSPLLAGMTDSTGGFTAPQLKGYVGTSAKGLADVPLVTQHEDPLLAHWRHGLGKTVAFTSDAKERWAADWTSWDEFAKFWSQTIRWVQRSNNNPNYQMQMTTDGSQGKITIDAVDSAGSFKDFLKIDGTVINPDLTTQTVTLHQTQPGRYEADFEVSKPGVYMLGAEAADPNGSGSDTITGGTALSYSPEFQNSGSNTALLGRIADMTGGRTLGADSDVFARSMAAYAQPTPLWPAILEIILGLFLLDVFTRRVLIGWSEVSEWSAAGWRAVARRLRGKAVVSETTEALLKAKQSVRGEQATPRENETRQRETFLASLQKVDVKESPLTQPNPEEAEARKQARAAAEAQDEKPKPAAPDSFTGQLLKARRKNLKSDLHSDEDKKE